ncbi:MAG TPA: hypothetical protein VI981_00645, partial [Candidatus Paceibacterota bacterium]
MPCAKRRLEQSNPPAGGYVCIFKAQFDRPLYAFFQPSEPSLFENLARSNWKQMSRVENCLWLRERSDLGNFRNRGDYCFLIAEAVFS